MDNISPQNPQPAFNTNNQLLQYLQSLDTQTVNRLSQPTKEVTQMMENNIMGMLGGLPQEQFDVTITTTREQLGQLLTSAMMSGYFLHNAQQRMKLEKQVSLTHEE